MRSFLLFNDDLNARCLFKTIDLRRHEAFSRFRSNGLWKFHISEICHRANSNSLFLYNQLFFEVEPDTLVMIDEPELSMNVVWQRNFLKDLQRIIELRKFDVLIATHSPQIIHDKWDWMVPLGEKVDDLDDETD